MILFLLPGFVSLCPVWIFFLQLALLKILATEHRKYSARVSGWNRVFLFAKNKQKIKQKKELCDDAPVMNVYIYK